MNGLFGNVQMNHGMPAAPDVAAAMVPGMDANVAPSRQQAVPGAMPPDQQALNVWLAQQEQAKQQQPAQKYSVGDPHLDKYINMFIGH